MYKKGLKIGKRRRVVVGLLAGMFSLVTLFQFAPQQVAAASDISASWKNATTVTLGGSALSAPVDSPGDFQSNVAGTPPGSQTFMSHPSGLVNMSFGCTISIELNIYSNASGQMDFSTGEVIFTTGGGATCSSSQLTQNIPGLSQPQNGGTADLGKNIAISNVNNRNGGGNGSTTVNVTAGMGPASDYTGLPKNDTFVLCAATGAYANNKGQLDTDCLAKKGGTVTAGPITSDALQSLNDGKGPNNGAEQAWTGKFASVKNGNYDVCSANFNACQFFSTSGGATTDVYINWGGAPGLTIPGTPPDTSASSGNGSNEPQLACDITFDITTIFSLKWLVCPIINAATFTVGKLDDAINNLLTVDTKTIFNSTDPNNGFHVAWNSFRFFALGIIVVAALIMVISQAAGVEILDAYTIRKLLPRLLFAAVFIALSWNILQFFADLSNMLGTGVRTLIYAPFSGMNKAQIGGGSSFSLALIGTGGALAFGWIGLLSFALTGMLAALVAFAVLVLRKMLILLIIMTAPFAIACYVLPNTQKAWTFWKDGAISIIAAFPIITGFIAIGRVFAVTSYNAPTNLPGGQTINQIIAVIAYFAPYFLISAAFRMAGGLVATVGGVVNDRSRGAFDRLKNYRSGKVSDNMTRMKEGRRFADNNPLARTFNSTTAGVGTGWKGRFGLGERGRQATDQTLRSGMANLMKSAAYATIQDDDPALRAATYGSAGAAMRGMMAKGFSQQEAQRAVSAVQTSIGFGRVQQVAAAQGLVSTGTGYTDMQDMVETLGRAANGNSSTAASLAGFANFQAKQKGRHDWAPGFGNLNRAVQRAAGTAPGGALSSQEYTGSGGLNEQAWKSADPVGLMRDRTPAFKNFVNHWQKQYTDAHSEYTAAQATGNTAGMQAAVQKGKAAEAAFYEMEQSKMYGSGDNVSALDSVLSTLDAPGGSRKWLGSVSTGSGQIPVYRRGDDRRPDASSPTGMEDPNRFYQDLRDHTALSEAQRDARVMQRGGRE